jgi:hypothetical protein
MPVFVSTLCSKLKLLLSVLVVQRRTPSSLRELTVSVVSVFSILDGRFLTNVFLTFVIGQANKEILPPLAVRSV